MSSRNISFIFLTLASLHCAAQSSPLGPAAARMPFRGYDPGYFTDYVNLDPGDLVINGNPYENEAYQMGKVLFEGEVQTFLFRFNAMRDRVELKDASGRLFHLKKNPDFQPYFGGKFYLLLRYFPDKGGPRLGYFVPLNHGAVKLYFKPRKVFEQGMAPPNGYEDFRQPAIKDVSSYYIEINDRLEAVKLRRKDLLKVLDQHPREIRRYLHSQHPNLKSQEGALALINYYNSLL